MSELNIYQRLNNAQLELKAPKGQFNKFGNFKYRSAEDVLEAVKPINRTHGLNLKLTDEPQQVGDRIYIKATAILTNVDNPEETIELTAYAREALNKKGMDDSQVTGTASSYARKYCLNGMYLIDDTKDGDTDEHQNIVDNAPEAKRVTTSQIKSMRSVVKSISKLTNQTPEKAEQIMLKHQNLPNKVEELNENQYGEFLHYMNGLKSDLEKKAHQAKKKDEVEADGEQDSLFEGNSTKPKQQAK